MSHFEFEFASHTLQAHFDGTLFWPRAEILVVSDLHLGKSERMARRGGVLLPPYEITDTLTRLHTALERTNPRSVICLGDSFDDLQALDALSPENHAHLSSLMAGRKWIWIEGNHDAGPVNIGGTHLWEYEHQGITFRHIAQIGTKGEVSGHYHPKTTAKFSKANITKPSFLMDEAKLILPAFGTYTGGLRSSDPIFQEVLNCGKKMAILTGKTALPLPLP